jgi:hypothetical protein
VAGAAMLGELSRSGVGEPTDVDCVKSIDGLKEGCASSNAKLLKELRPDEGAEALLASTKADAALGRMQEPTLADEASLEHVLLNPRFGVRQEKDDGSIKVRAIDHLSWSPATADGGCAEHRPSKKARKEGSVNGHTAPSEKMRHDTLDVLAAAMRKHVEVMGSPPGLIKVGDHRA